MKTFQTLIYQVKETIATITLHRPEVFHALNKTLLREIREAFELAAADDEVRAVILTATGHKAFCSGADLKEGISDTKPSILLENGYNPMILAIRNIPKPVIGKINGVAAGAGCSLALACDVLIASENAVMTELFVGIGLVVDAGSSFFLPRLVGTQKAFDLCSTGRRVQAQECLSLGLVHSVVSADVLDDTVWKMAKQYAQAPTKAIGYIKYLLNQSYHSTLEQMLALEATYQDKAGETEDFKEGVNAFLEKRIPAFKGK